MHMIEKKELREKIHEMADKYFVSPEEAQMFTKDLIENIEKRKIEVNEEFLSKVVEMVNERGKDIERVLFKPRIISIESLEDPATISILSALYASGCHHGMHYYA